MILLDKTKTKESCTQFTFLQENVRNFENASGPLQNEPKADIMHKLLVLRIAIP